MPNTIQSVDRALALLLEVARRGDGVGVRELARATALSPPTAHALLKTLQARGFVELDDATRRYRLGLAALRLAEAADPGRRLAAFARPFVEALFAEFGETVTALTVTDGQVVVVSWRQSDHALAVTHPARVIDEPHHMASGLVLLAWLDEPERAEFAARQDYRDPGRNMPRSEAELLARLAAVREAGWAETENVRDSGVAAVSAPVLDALGRVALALACSAPVTRLDAATRARMRERVLATAAAMSARLGARGSAEEGEATR